MFKKYKYNYVVVFIMPGGVKVIQKEEKERKK